MKNEVLVNRKKTIIGVEPVTDSENFFFNKPDSDSDPVGVGVIIGFRSSPQISSGGAGPPWLRHYLLREKCKGETTDFNQLKLKNKSPKLILIHYKSSKISKSNFETIFYRSKMKSKLLFLSD